MSTSDKLSVELVQPRFKLSKEPACRIATPKLGKEPHPPPVELFGIRVDLDCLLQCSQSLADLALPSLELGKPGEGIEDWRRKDSRMGSTHSQKLPSRRSSPYSTAATKW
jgi:hypothetical protein